MSTYALSDLHGNLKVFENILKLLGDNDIVYFLGDAIDRGDDGWKICKAILDDERFIYLKGNHEDMMVKALATGDSMDEWIWYVNGGKTTHNAIKQELSTELETYLEKIIDLPLSTCYNNTNNQLIHLSHAGFTPPLDFDSDLLWNRTHYLNRGWAGGTGHNEYVVHGHTPYYAIIDDFRFAPEKYPYEIKNGAMYYRDGFKICIDDWTASTGEACLLNLDTLCGTLVR